MTSTASSKKLDAKITNLLGRQPAHVWQRLENAKSRTQNRNRKAFTGRIKGKPLPQTRTTKLVMRTVQDNVTTAQRTSVPTSRMSDDEMLRMMAPDEMCNRSSAAGKAAEAPKSTGKDHISNVGSTAPKCSTRLSTAPPPLWSGINNDGVKLQSNRVHPHIFLQATGTTVGKVGFGKFYIA